MEYNLHGLVAIGMGIIVIVFREKLNRSAIDFQKENFGIKTSEQMTRLSIRLTPILGILFLIMGLKMMY